MTKSSELFSELPFVYIDFSLPFYDEVLNVMRKRITASLKTAI